MSWVKRVIYFGEKCFCSFHEKVKKTFPPFFQLRRKKCIANSASVDKSESATHNVEILLNKICTIELICNSISLIYRG